MASRAGRRGAGPRAWAALVALALTGCAPGPPREAEPAPTTDPAGLAGQRSAEALDEAVPDSEAPGCSAAVGVDGEVVWAGARGVANVDTGEPLETSTALDIASTAKQLTAVAVLVLVERGELGLDDPVAEHLDDMPAWAQEVTLEDLMHHTSGITDFLDVPDPAATFGPPPITNADILEYVRTSPDAHKQLGGAFDYSNTNYNLLADVVTEVTGTEFAVWLQAEVFEPLDLSMRFWPALPTDAAGHVTGGDGFVVVTPGPWADVGSGGILTTPSELVRWADHIRTSSVVGAQTFEAALADAVPGPPGSRYGPGIAVRADGSLGHGGDGDGMLTDFAVSADRHIAVAVTCNHREVDRVCCRSG